MKSYFQSRIGDWMNQTKITYDYEITTTHKKKPRCWYKSGGQLITTLFKWKDYEYLNLNLSLSAGLRFPR